MTASSDGARVLAFVDDLMDRSRISAARPDVEFVRGGLASLGAGPVDSGDSGDGTIVVVDGGRPRNLDLVDELVAAGCRVVVFLPHVDTAAAEQARSAGAAVLSRSRFFRDVAMGIAMMDEDTDR